MDAMSDAYDKIVEERLIENEIDEQIAVEEIMEWASF